MKSSAQRNSITRRLTMILMVTSSTAVLVAGVAFIAFSSSTSRWAAVGDLTSLARITGQNCGAALSFNLPGDAVDMLATLSEKPSIARALLHDAEGRFFAEFKRDPEGVYPPVPEDVTEGHTFSGRHLWIAQRIEQDKQFLGTIWLQDDLSQLRAALYRDLAVLGAVTLAALLVAYWIAARLRTRITRSILHLAETADTVSEKHDYSVRAVAETQDEVGRLTLAFNGMLDDIQEREAALRKANEELSQAHDELEQRVEQRTAELKKHSALKTGLTELHEAMRGEVEPGDFGKNVLRFLCRHLQCPVGAFYVTDLDGVSSMAGSYAFALEPGRARTFQMEEGLVGQAAREQKTLELQDVPPDYFQIRSGLGDAAPHVLRVSPIVYENRTAGVIELGLLQEFGTDETLFLEQALPSIGMGLHSAVAREQTRLLLEQTQGQARELQQQQEELQVTNEELEEQAKALQQSQEELQQQREELQVTNEELEEQKAQLEKVNREVEASRRELQRKALELERASSYKSEFLANMSHELRTPLNSLLILSKMLMDNPERNLSGKQVEYSATIYQSGTDLLDVIDDILDLSKVEAGMLEVHWESTPLQSLLQHVERTFHPVAEGKQLELRVEKKGRVPDEIRTDAKRVQQILKNLLSNAFKFCQEGEVAVCILRPQAGVRFVRPHLDPKSTIAIAVSDTGIGIPKDKQEEIFKAFQQADGTVSREYGGTGLGLSISREMSWLLGGELHLESEEGVGSTFTLYLPEIPLDKRTTAGQAMTIDLRAEQVSPAGEVAASPAPEAEPGAAPGESGEKTMLIIESDERLANLIGEVAEQKGYRKLLAVDGHEGLKLAVTRKPTAVILDLKLPGLDGLTVMHRLIDNPDTRHIPIHAITALETGHDARKMGAVGCLRKPVASDDLQLAFKRIEDVVSSSVKHLLIVEGDTAERQGMVELVKSDDTEITGVTSTEEAYALLKGSSFDCMILDLSLPGEMTPMELLRRMNNEEDVSHPPVIVYTDQDLTTKEEEDLQRFAESIVIKGPKSPERLVDEVALFLHRVEAELPEAQRQMMESLHAREAVFEDKTVLVVDDDMRNLFALTHVLEDKGMHVLVAKNGREALERLKTTPATDLVLMDIMMPEMDGYEAIQQIRQERAVRNLPIIALTAKAMKGDREKCIDAGANDYLAKPVDVDRLLSLMRVWLQ